MLDRVAKNETYMHMARERAAGSGGRNPRVEMKLWASSFSFWPRWPPRNSRLPTQRTRN